VSSDPEVKVVSSYKALLRLDGVEKRQPMVTLWE